jgi:hypothetical protein
MSTYYFYVGSPSGVGYAATLNTKLTNDLDLGGIFTSSIYNNISGDIEISFTSLLNDFQINLLNNLVNLVVYGATVGVDVYILDKNTTNRTSYEVLNPPTVNHDSTVGYDLGSMVVTQNDDCYICTTSTPGAANWNKLPLTYPYATISDTTTQTIISTTTEQLITFDSNELLNKISHTIGTSQITLNESGVYNIHVRAQLYGSGSVNDIWLRKNGSDIPRTNTRNTTFTPNEIRIIDFSYNFSVFAGDYIELVQSSNSLTSGLLAVSGNTNPTRPDIPSIIVTIRKVSE